jgi:hypothetical protein
MKSELFDEDGFRQAVKAAGAAFGAERFASVYEANLALNMDMLEKVEEGAGILSVFEVMILAKAFEIDPLRFWTVSESDFATIAQSVEFILQAQGGDASSSLRQIREKSPFWAAVWPVLRDKNWSDAAGQVKRSQIARRYGAMQ